MKLGVGIMAHRSRTVQARLLETVVRADHLHFSDGQGENYTGDYTWSWLSTLKTDWSIVLQDDAMPVGNFRGWAMAYLESAPRTAVSFYVGTCRPRFEHVLDAVNRAERNGATWLQADTLLWGVGVAMPTADIPAFLEFGQRHPELAYDTRIGAFWKQQGIPVRYTWPSLVDHADGPSLVQPQRPARVRDCPRVAHRVGTPIALGGDVELIQNRGARRIL